MTDDNNITNQGNKITTFIEFTTLNLYIQNPSNSLFQTESTTSGFAYLDTIDQNNFTTNGSNSGFMYQLIDEYEDWKRLCLVKEMANIFIGGGNILIIACISIERFFYIQYPLKYSGIVTMKLCFQIIAGCFIFDILTTSTFLIGVNISLEKECNTSIIPSKGAYFGALVPIFGVLSILTLFLYIRISIIAVSKRNKVAFTEAQSVVRKQAKLTPGEGTPIH